LTCVENENYQRRKDETGGLIKAKFLPIGIGATRNHNPEKQRRLMHVPVNEFYNGHVNHSLVSKRTSGLVEAPLARLTVALNALAKLRFPIERQKLSPIGYGISSLRCPLDLPLEAGK
jgi:hypothetical protein